MRQGFTTEACGRALAGIAFALTAIGVLMIYSASTSWGAEKFDDPAHLFKRQLVGAALGLLAFGLCAALPYRFWGRHSRKLLSHFNIAGELTPYHEHNAAKERPRLLARLRAGSSVALISDAGTPLISDPGYKLVREALDEGFMVTSIPGASAALAALTSAGLPTDTFLFAGFLPAKSGPRRARLEELKSIPATLVFFETAPRLEKSLADTNEVLGAREAAVAKELTKLHETVTRGTLDRLAAESSENSALKGELVVVVAPPTEDRAGITDEKIVEQLGKALNLESFRDAVRSVSEVLQVPRSRVYEVGLSVKPKAD